MEKVATIVRMDAQRHVLCAPLVLLMAGIASCSLQSGGLASDDAATTSANGTSTATSTTSSTVSSTATSTVTATTTASSSGGSGGDGGNSTTTSSSGGEGGSGGSSTMSSTGGGGSGGSGGGNTGGAGGGTGGSGGGCGGGEVDCDGACVAENDPAFGCGSCTPCDLANATSVCFGGQCVVDACVGTFDDCDGLDATGCEADLMNDLDHCGACNDSCSVTGADCGAGICMGPCGEVPETGLHVCWVYGAFPVMSSQFVGLAGGEADPSQGETIEEVFLDPWCVSPNIGEPFVLCPLTNDPTFDIQFRAGLHLTPSMSTITGTWDCSTDSCAGSVYVYEDGVEIGSLISDVETGVVTTIPHFNPPGLLNVKVAPL